MVSLLVHAVLLWTLLPHDAAGGMPDTPATIEVEMVNQPEQAKGTPAVQPTQAAPPPPPAPAPEAPQQPKGELPPPAPPTPQPPEPNPQPQSPPPPTPQPAAPSPAPPPQQQAPAGPSAPPSSVHLGEGDDDVGAFSVTGDNVVPPRLDARVHNKAPVYPEDAIRRHAGGVVGVRIHVTETGTPAYVDIIHSSGDASLDGSVREAVMLWRFQPASDRGRPVAFDYVMNFDFSMTRH